MGGTYYGKDDHHFGPQVLHRRTLHRQGVARALGIKLYDKELITMAAKNSGLSEEAVAASENGAPTACCTACIRWAMTFRWAIRSSSCRAASSSSWPKRRPASSWPLRRLCPARPQGRAAHLRRWRLAYGKENNMLQAEDEGHQGRDRQDQPQPCRLLQLLHPGTAGAMPTTMTLAIAPGAQACVNMILAAAEAKEEGWSAAPEGEK